MNDRNPATNEEIVTSSRTGRPKRKAARKQNQLMKNLIDNSALKITAKQAPASDEVPTHGFNYDDWVALLDIHDDEPVKPNPKPVDGVNKLRAILVERNINPDDCVEEVLAMVHDLIDYHTVGARIEMAAVKIQT